MSLNGKEGENVSVIIPARNEAGSLKTLLPGILARLPHADVVVVDDGSTDETAGVVRGAGARVVSHPVGRGNGAAIKTGARAAKGDVLVFMDADGQHLPEDIPRLLESLGAGYDMAVGARTWASQAGVHRALANAFYNRFATWMVGQKVRDLTSGFRAVRAHHFRKYLYLLPNGFSYPTTITMSFFRAGLSVDYVSIRAGERKGSSHIRLARDGLRFLLIIFKVGTLYSPLKIFLPFSAAFFLAGLAYYVYTFIYLRGFTNLSALMLTTSVLVFLIGLISEQITTLYFKDSEEPATEGDRSRE